MQEPPAAAAAKSLQSCPTLWDPIAGSPPGSPVPGILQARTLEWVTICFSNAWKWKVKVKSLSHVRLLATPWTAAYQALPSMGFSRQEYWSEVPLLSLCVRSKIVYFLANCSNLIIVNEIARYVSTCLNKTKIPTFLRLLFGWKLFIFNDTYISPRHKFNRKASVKFCHNSCGS